MIGGLGVVEAKGGPVNRDIECPIGSLIERSRRVASGRP